MRGQDLNYCAKMSAVHPHQPLSLGPSSSRLGRNESLRNHIIAGCHVVTLDRPSPPPR